MNISALLASIGKGPTRRRLVCKDGYWLSVQASHMHYCNPKCDTGPWTSFEVLTCKKVRAWGSNANTDTHMWLYGWVNAEQITRLIRRHGGLV